MIKKLLLLIAFITLATVALVSFQNDQNKASITNFEECVVAGYPVMEIYPEQCSVPDGETLTREIN